MAHPGRLGHRTDRVVFHGHSRVDVKRRAVRWWSRHAAATMPLPNFLAACRMDPTERTIVFHHDA